MESPSLPEHCLVVSRGELQRGLTRARVRVGLKVTGNEGNEGNGEFQKWDMETGNVTGNALGVSFARHFHRTSKKQVGLVIQQVTRYGDVATCFQPRVLQHV